MAGKTGRDTANYSKDPAAMATRIGGKLASVVKFSQGVLARAEKRQDKATAKLVAKTIASLEKVAATLS